MTRKASGLSRDDFSDDTASGRDGSGVPMMTVTQLTMLVQDTLRETFPEVILVGEVSRTTYHSSGHIYLALKDEGAVIDAVVWRSLARKLNFRIEAGLEVICRGSIDVYPPRGSYQFIIERIEPRGEGALQKKFNELLEKLRKEGLFDEAVKKDLPLYPEKIGIVTSPTGAAVQDMIRVISRRYPLARILIKPVRVQGKPAAGEIADAVRFFNEKHPESDVLIVGRGGGSLEDLWSFNEEVVARALFASEIPVISAVGHETDVTISDLVADRRAATPSEAAELVVPDRREELEALRGLAERTANALRRHLSVAQQRLQSVSKSYAMRRPDALFRTTSQRLDELLSAAGGAYEHYMEGKSQRLDSLAARFEALNPLAVLSRGYSVTRLPDGQVVRDAAQLAPGDEIISQLKKGKVRSRILSTEPGENEPDT